MNTAWVDGQFVDGAAVPASDRSFAHGLGLFETLRAAAGRLPLWGRHLARLELSARVLEIPCEPPRDLSAAAGELLDRTRRRDGVLRITLSAGRDAPTWVMTTRERTDLGRPVTLTPSRARRGPADPTAAHKTTSRAFYRLAMRDAREVDADDVLLLGRGDEVLETAVGNLFCMVRGELVTPPLDGRVLPGIARGVLCDAFGDRVVRRSLALAELGDNDGLWVTNAVHGPRPAHLVGAQARVDDGGPHHAELRQAWEAALAPSL